MILLLAVSTAAAVYQLLALLAAFRHLRQVEPETREFSPVSILKPVRGPDPRFYEAIRSHAVQDYPEYEILFGVQEVTDPAVPEIRRLQAEYPHVPIRLVFSSSKALNAKVGILEDLASAAHHSVLVVNDSDIVVPPDYLRRLMQPLENSANGIVTCLYRAAAATWRGRFEAIGISTEFAPSVLVARMLGVSEFALGSTMAFRAPDLARAGGFRAIADYLADDYQLSRRLNSLGLKVVLSKMVVETCLSAASWREVWNHQVRWARTIRVSRGGGYAGMPVMAASLWSLALCVAGMWWPAGVLLALRLLAGLVASSAVLGERLRISVALLMPFRDLWGVAIWCAGLFGKTVIWRGRRIILNRGGRIASTKPV